MTKKMKSLLPVALVATLLFSSCGPTPLSGKPGSSGKTLELVVVANNHAYSGNTRVVLDTIFGMPQPGLEGFAQPEPRFDVVRLSPDQFNGNTMFQAHRNLLILEISVDNPNKVFLEQDKWSSPQVAVRVAATDKPHLDSLLLANRERLLQEFYNQEYRRMRKVFGSTPGVKVNQAVKQKYGFEITCPEEFILAKTEDAFSWIRKETKDFSLDVLIDQHPYESPHQFDEEVILNTLDTMMKRYVPSANEGSWTGTERRDFFHSRPVHIGELFAIETRGRWRSFNDIMGGPFVCYTFQTPDNEDVVTLMGFVFSPSFRSKAFSKRDLLMQVDGICRSVKY